MKLFIILYASQKQHKIFLRICIIATKIQENGKVFHKSYSPKKNVFHGNNYGKKELKRTRKGATIYRVPSIAG